MNTRSGISVPCEPLCTFFLVFPYVMRYRKKPENRFTKVHIIHKWPVARSLAHSIDAHNLSFNGFGRRMPRGVRR